MTTTTQSPPTLLVVDDDPNLRLTMVLLLKQAGYTVLEAATAAEAVAMTHAHRPAMVLLDVVLPDGDGRETAQQLKTDPALTGTLVVLVSGLKTSPEDQAIGLRQGLADGYILRPISPQVLLGWVEVLLRLRATQEELREKERLFRTLTEMAPVGIYRADPTGAYLYVNRRWSEITGLDLPQAKGWGWLEGLYFTDRDRVAAAWYQAMQTQDRFNREYRVEAPDGTLTWVLGQSMAETGPSGEITGYIGTITDITERKQAEEERQQREALRQSEEKYRTIINVSPVPMALNNRQQHITFLNPAFVQTFGYTLADIPTLADWWPKAYPDHDYRQWVADTWQTRLAQAQQTGAAFLPMELTVRCKNGADKIVLASAAMFNTPDNNHLVVLYDLTEQKQTEQALRESENKLKTLFELLPVGVTVLNSERAVVYLNPAMEKILDISCAGLRRGDYRNRTYLRPDGSPMPATEFASVRATKEQQAVHNVETGIVKENGEVIWVSVSAAPVAFSEWNVVIVTIDITARKRAETAVREQEKNFSALAENAYDGILIATADGHHAYANRRAAEITGYSVSELLAINIRQLVPPNEILTLTDRLHRRIAGEDVPNQYETRIITKTGFDKPIEVTAVHTIWQGQSADLITLRDITERKQATEMQAQLEAQNRQIQKTESLARMAGAIAHHFNNQLTAVMGYLELAMLNNLPHTTVKNLSQAMTAGRRATEVSNLMLTYLGQTSDKLEPLDLAATCTLNLPMLRAAMPKNITLEINLPVPGPIISANPSRIQQLLTNLMTNAWESMGNGPGHIDLIVKTVTSANIPIINRFPLNWQPQDQPYACLEVGDTGSGIPGPDIEKIFDPFFSTKFTGRGLGLAVVLGIVRGHSGVVTVESQPGRGSIFRLFFPMMTPTVTLPSPDSAQLAKPDGPDMVILLVEDEQIVRQMATAMLTHLGFGVLTAQDGIEAVELFRQHQMEIKCVLCDLTMPGMDGWETLAALRKLAPGLPVVLVSGYDEDQVMASHHSERPQAFLSKPYQLKGISAAIHQAIINAQTKPD